MGDDGGDGVEDKASFSWGFDVNWTLAPLGKPDWKDSWTRGGFISGIVRLRKSLHIYNKTKRTDAYGPEIKYQFENNNNTITYRH